MPLALILLAVTVCFAEPWKRHTIDATGRGADGVKLADANGDGRLDVVSGWEEAGEVRVYFNPGPGKSRDPWPTVTVGKAASPEDAIFADLDNDGFTDVISFCEGKTRAVFVHWGSRAGTWEMQPVPAARDRTMWMFGAMLQVDGKHGADIIAGGKLAGAGLGWFESPANPRDLAAWKWHPMRPVGWVMSILTPDMDGDGDSDVLFSDRRGERSGVYWLENPSWKEHAIGSAGREVMFIDHVDFDRDGRKDVLAAVKPGEIHVHLSRSANGTKWESSVIPVRANVGTAKAVRAADLDGDGTLEIAYSCEQALGEKTGVVYLKRAASGEWIAHDVAGPEGVKYDLIELIDIDGDGDLDILTTEEVDRLGVIWYENPAR